MIRRIPPRGGRFTQESAPRSTSTRQSPRRTCRSGRTAFTLYEMLLVLALLMMIGVISWPALTRLFAEDKLRKSLSLLELKFAAARIQALERQVPYQFCYEPGGTRFVMVPALFVETGAASSTAERPWITAEELPEGYRLEGRESPQSLTTAPTPSNATASNVTAQTLEIPEDWLAEVPDPSRFRGVNWSPPILIRPDGSATASELALIDDQNQEYRLAVRGITGTLLTFPPSRQRGAP